MHHSAKSAGFTLLELLIVLVLIGAASSFIAPRVFRLLEPDPARAFAEQLQRRIELARNDAILKNETQRVSWNLNDASYQDSRGLLKLPPDWRIDIGEVESSPSTITSISKEQYTFSIRPDGTSDAVPITLLGPDDLRLRVTIGAHTGKILIKPGLGDHPKNDPQ